MVLADPFVLDEIANLLIADTPVAVVDTETTGLYPDGDRIIEIAIVRVTPDDEPRVVLDTLVNPERPISATEIHGITATDVSDAPTFNDIADDIIAATDGAVLASYNAFFDERFTRYELRRTGRTGLSPLVCLMKLQQRLARGARRSLRDACDALGVAHGREHRAADDAMAGARLWQVYAAASKRAGISTFGELVGNGSEPAIQRAPQPGPVPIPAVQVAARPGQPKARAAIADSRRDGSTSIVFDRQWALSGYWEALKAAMADLAFTDAEARYLAEKRQTLDIGLDDLRWMHAMAFAGVLALVCQDKAITDDEAGTLSSVSRGLHTAGWAPGD